MPKSALEPDIWLGGLLGREAFRLTLPANPEAAMPLLTPPRNHEAVFIYAKVEVGSPGHSRYLEDLGFRLVDTNTTFEKSLDPGAWIDDGSMKIRLSVPEDRDAAVRLAERSFRKSRFHADPSIPDAVADRIKGEWVRNFFLGERGHPMVVAESPEGGLAGFLLLLKSPDTLTIDLIAVDEAQWGRGLAAAMTRFAESAFADAALVRVGTQIANAQAIRSYQKMGFALVHSQYIYHYHGAMPDALTGADA